MIRSCREVPAQRIDLGRAAGVLVIARRLGNGEKRIADNVVIRHDDGDEMIAVGAHETVTPVVERVAVLPHAGNCLVAIVKEVEAKIHAIDIKRPGVWPPAALDHAAAEAVDYINPVIKAENGMANAELRILGGKAFEKGLASVGLARAFAVAEIKNVRRTSHDRATAPGQDAVAKKKSLGEHRS